jgi:hypothetical protein
MPESVSFKASTLRSPKKTMPRLGATGDDIDTVADYGSAEKMLRGGLRSFFRNWDGAWLPPTPGFVPLRILPNPLTLIPSSVAKLSVIGCAFTLMTEAAVRCIELR